VSLCSDDGSDGGDGQNLRVDILHDFAGLLPNRCGRCRLAEHYRHTGCDIAHIQIAA